MLTRRQVLAGVPLASFAQSPKRPKIAAICTTYFKFSHSQHIVDRFLIGYGWNGEHHKPPMDLVSIFVDQQGRGDLAKGRVQEFPSTKMFPTIAEALTMGREQACRRRRAADRRAWQIREEREAPNEVSALRILS